MGKLVWISKLLDKIYTAAPAFHKFAGSAYEFWGKIRKAIGK